MCNSPPQRAKSARGPEWLLHAVSAYTGINVGWPCVAVVSTSVASQQLTWLGSRGIISPFTAIYSNSDPSMYTICRTLMYIFQAPIAAPRSMHRSQDFPTSTTEFIPKSHATTNSPSPRAMHGRGWRPRERAGAGWVVARCTAHLQTPPRPARRRRRQQQQWAGLRRWLAREASCTGAGWRAARAGIGGSVWERYPRACRSVRHLGHRRSAPSVVSRAAMGPGTAGRCSALTRWGVTSRG
jgi:hypothetical protein